MGKMLEPSVGYIRMSTDQQESSPERQRQDILKLAERMGYEVIEWFQDNGLTGTESSKRPEFQRLMKECKAGQFKAVLLSEQSRMSREDIFACMDHWRKFRDAGVAIITSQRGELRFDNLGGIITAMVDQYGAREESVRLAHRVVGGKRLGVNRGQRQCQACMGYDREILDEKGAVVRRVGCGEKLTKPHGWTSRLVLSTDEKSVEAIRIMFQSVDAGLSYGRVARDLNRQGYKTVRGNLFDSVHLVGYLTNPAYVGDVVIGRKIAGRSLRRGKFKSSYDEGGVCCEGAHEAIIPRDLFERVQKIVETRRRGPHSSRPGRHLLSGLVYLADTRLGIVKLFGQSWPSEGGLSGGRAYRVNPAIRDKFPDVEDYPWLPADLLESAVLRKLCEYLGQEANQRAIEIEISRRLQNVDGKVASLEKRLAEVRSKIQRGTENLALANREDVPGVSRLLGEWREQEKTLVEKLDAIRGDSLPAPEAVRIMAQIRPLLDKLWMADPEMLSFAIRQTVKRLTVRRRRLSDGVYSVNLWDGTIEFCDEVGAPAVLLLDDDDIGSRHQWRKLADFVRQCGRPVAFSEIANNDGFKDACLSRLVRQAMLAGKIRRLDGKRVFFACGS